MVPGLEWDSNSSSETGIKELISSTEEDVLVLEPEIRELISSKSEKDVLVLEPEIRELISSKSKEEVHGLQWDSQVLVLETLVCNKRNLKNVETAEYLRSEDAIIDTSEIATATVNADTGEVSSQSNVQFKDVLVTRD